MVADDDGVVEVILRELLVNLLELSFNRHRWDVVYRDFTAVLISHRVDDEEQIPVKSTEVGLCEELGSILINRRPNGNINGLCSLHEQMVQQNFATTSEVNIMLFILVIRRLLEKLVHAIVVRSFGPLKLVQKCFVQVQDYQ